MYHLTFPANSVGFHVRAGLPRGWPAQVLRIGSLVSLTLSKADLIGMRISSFPNLSTGRLLLRRFEMDDLHPYARLLQDPETHPYITEAGPVATPTVREIIERNRDSHLQAGHLYWALAMAKSHTFVGYIAAHNLTNNPVSLSYAVDRAWRRKGLMAESLREVMRFLFSLGAPALEARVHLGNRASERLLDSLGFQRGSVENGRTVFFALAPGVA